MELDEVRNAFSKASIVFDNGNIIVIYSRDNSNEGLAITESAGDGLNVVFAELIDRCDNLTVSVSKDYVAMKFVLPSNSGDSFVVFPPVDWVLTQKELDDAVDELLSRPLSADHKEFLNKQKEFLEERAHGVDLDDEYQVGELTKDFTQFLHSLMPDRKSFSLPTMQRFVNMKRLASTFHSITAPWEIDVFEPDNEKVSDRSGLVFDGCIDLFLCAEDLGRDSYKSVISGRSKDCLLELIRSCDTVGIEVSFLGIAITFNLFP